MSEGFLRGVPIKTVDPLARWVSGGSRVFDKHGGGLSCCGASNKQDGGRACAFQVHVFYSIHTYIHTNKHVKFIVHLFFINHMLVGVGMK